MLRFGHKQSHVDYTMFIKQGNNTITFLIGCIDDIVVTDNDIEQVTHLKTHLAKEFEIKDSGLLSYFLEIEVARYDKGTWRDFIGLSITFRGLHVEPKPKHRGNKVVMKVTYVS